eukprot:1835934-Alexandrium_andersonii.AAC.1
MHGRAQVRGARVSPGAPAQVPHRSGKRGLGQRGRNAQCPRSMRRHLTPARACTLGTSAKRVQARLR